MAAGLLIIPTYMPARDPNGRPVLARIRVYQNNTLVPEPVYTDNTLTVPHVQPIECDASGQFPEVWIDTSKTVTWAYDDDKGKTKSLSGVTAAIASAAAALAILGAPSLAASNTFTADQLVTGIWRATGALAGLGFDDRTTSRQFQIYSAGDIVRIYDAATDILSYSRAGALRLTSSDPSVALVDTGVTAGAGDGVRVDAYASSNGSLFQNLAGGGFKILLNKSGTRDFSSNKTLLTVFSNTDETDATAFFPNGGNDIGEDGYWEINTNVLQITSRNKLRADSPTVTGITVGSGAITAVTISSKPGYTANLDPAGNPAHRTRRVVAHQPGHAGTAFVGWLVTDGSGNATSVWIQTQGTGYVSGQVTVVADPPPGATKLDNGPAIHLYRDTGFAPANGSVLGAIYFGGWRTGSSSLDTIYACLVASIVSNDATNPEGELILATASTYSLNAGNTPRWYHGRNIYPVGLSRPSGDGIVNATAYQISNTDLFGAARTWLANQTIRNAASAGVLELESTTGALSAVGALVGYGTNASAARTSMASVQMNMVTATAGAEDALLLLRTRRGGAMATRFNVSSGFYAEGVADPGAGNFAGNGFYVGANKVLGARKTGWGVPTGTLTRTTYVTGSVTLPQLAERVAAIIADLEATAGHGLFGA